MLNVSKLFDISIGFGSHGYKECPHFIVGIKTMGSPDTFVNNLSAIRSNLDLYVHNCPHCGVGMSLGGNPTVLVNMHPIHRLGDPTTEFCGIGITITGSPNVFA